MSTLLFEDMIRAETATHVCRIWREADIDMAANLKVTNEELKSMAVSMMEKGVLLPLIVTTLAAHKNVNSVEIISKTDGCGVCVHKDWP